MTFHNLDIPDPEYTTSLQSLIERKEVVKDLGVLMNCNCKFSEQLDKLCSTMQSLSSWVFHTFSSHSKTLLLTLWKVLIIPHHDYCSQLWSPHKFKDIEKLELIQWKYLQKTENCPHTYWEALKFFGIFSLQRQWERYRIFCC